ncbi:hypothetical protein N7539_005975 [Penicillium diatomitis]|uniref:Zn(2)-C6 fungal-type domain-containing protein n=1 Tax=Penicillium diatomitis TaxID=2819901 RepID=A0A9X0BUH4_9EURO|nr:uncharacterized protein N7539_005975 [Penicillium diatomitis]KAJ5484179.1 hypothetical protein N7539_005975 [Penicillium diatomitis]
MQSSNDGTSKRTARACDSCYKRKIKCDAAKPKCNWCGHHGLPCTFDRVTQRKRKIQDEAGRPRAARLSERISRIEQLLASNNLLGGSDRPDDDHRAELGEALDDMITPSPSPSNSGTNGPQFSHSVGVHFAGRELGVISLLTGIPFLLPEGQDWIQSRTGQVLAHEKLSSAHPPWERERDQINGVLLTSLTNQNLLELPERRIVRTYLEAYKKTAVMRRVFPVIDPDFFEVTMHIAYQDYQNSSRQMGSRACVLAFLAFISRVPMINDLRLEIPVDHEILTFKARSLITQILHAAATLDSLQATTILILYELCSGNMRLASFLTALASRQIFMLGAHLSQDHLTPSSDRSEKRHKQLRNVFWVCYAVDKDIALRTGEPPVLTDQNCDLTLPEGYMNRAALNPERDDSFDVEPVFPYELRLSLIKSRAYNELYSFSALQKTDAELLKSIRELDDDLEAWRLSIPSEWRPTMSFSQETSDSNMSMHSVMLRVNYYLCMSIIHQASSRCKAWMQGSGLIEGVSSSLALSVEASRSTLCYMEAAEHVLSQEAIWILIFYPLSALLTIFCSILQNPLDPRSRGDLDHLKTATSMLARLFSNANSENDIEHMKLIADYVGELKRLAECAIEKAWQEHVSTPRLGNLTLQERAR